MGSLFVDPTTSSSGYYSGRGGRNTVIQHELGTGVFRFFLRQKEENEAIVVGNEKEKVYIIGVGLVVNIWTQEESPAQFQCRRPESVRFTQRKDWPATPGYLVHVDTRRRHGGPCFRQKEKEKGQEETFQKGRKEGQERQKGLLPKNISSKSVGTLPAEFVRRGVGRTRIDSQHISQWLNFFFQHTLL